jgi:Uma2 family endonuclease
MSTLPNRRYTPDEYLARERTAQVRSEYLAGEIFAMAGGSRQHGRIARNLIARLDEQLRNTPCEVFGSDMRVKVVRTGLYTYPDVTIACAELEFEDRDVDTLLNPRVIFEVLSDSTEAYDRGIKFDHYREIPSLTEYLLVAQAEPLIERLVRQPDASWRLTVFKGPDAVLALETVPCRLKLAEVYFKVSFGRDGEPA